MAVASLASDFARAPREAARSTKARPADGFWSRFLARLIAARTAQAQIEIARYHHVTKHHG